MAANQERPPIPSEIKRQVRQRCGFGCVMCGEPLYEYEHMLEWAKVKRHVAEEITLLCRFHHGQKTAGLIPINDIMAANNKPFNIDNKVSKSLCLHYSGKNNVSFCVGDSILKYPEFPENYAVYPIVIDDFPIIGFIIRDGNMLLNFTAFNEENEVIFQILENELIYKTDNWDVEWVGKVLTLREGKGKVLLKVSFEPPGTVRIISARILLNGVEIHAKKNYIYSFNNSNFIGNFTANTTHPLGFVFGRRTSDLPCIGYFSNIKRYNVDRKKSLAFLRDGLSKRSNEGK